MYSRSSGKPASNRCGCPVLSPTIIWQSCQSAKEGIEEEDRQASDGWRFKEIRSARFHGHDQLDWQEVCGNYTTTLIANEIRKCQTCKLAFQRVFSIPEVWWSDYCKRSNGYFGCQTDMPIENASTITSFSSWAFFEVKTLGGNLDYAWSKTNIFTIWSSSTNQSVVLIFDKSPPISKDSPLLQQYPIHLSRDPFGIYLPFCDDLTRQFDASVWAVRTFVRKVESLENPQGKPEPDYRRLHDIARHATHVTETLDVARETMDGLIGQHLSMKSTVSSHIDWQVVHERLQFFRQLMGSLRSRSASNEKRLLNEIQLAFHSVAQYDSRISVQIGQATQVDSMAMKTVASLTLIFLPPTFICAIFSMSFFSIDSEAGWVVSDKFWVYWTCAIPITLMTYLLWHIRQKYICRRSETYSSRVLPINRVWQKV